ncbi:hypothetical protein MNBD_ALPHA06-1520 [hydrothermal vent metagenome]|uniref:Peptidase S9 prolyl oligopeptidase catalytic domain-containing protein n=1 Tax=hydrothermal vent metagenome TaxID=652676 RepID=A0A3B0RWK5_9ZZZZ
MKDHLDRMNKSIFSALMILALGASLALTGCMEQPPEPVTEQQQTTPAYIPRAALFHPPVQYQGRISPNGAKVSWLSLKDGGLNLFIANSDDPASAKQYTNTKNGVEIHYWSPNSAFVLFTQHSSDLQHLQTFSLNVQSGEVIKLGPDQKNVDVKLQKVSRNWPNSALISINDRDAHWPDLYRINLRTAERKLVLKNNKYIRLIADDDLVPRIGITSQADGSQTWVLLLRDGQTKTLFQVPASKVKGTKPLRFDPSGTVLYMLDQRNMRHSIFTSIDLLDGRRQVLAEVPGFDIERVWFHPVTTQPLAGYINADLPQWLALDQGFAPALEQMRQQLGPHFNILAATSDAMQLVLYSDQPDRAGKYSLFNRETGNTSTMFETALTAAITANSKSRMVKIITRDNFKMIGYLSPATVNADNQPQAAPLVIIPQPWPGSRMVYGFDPQIPWLNSRGYSVLEINTRGAGRLGFAYKKQQNIQLAASDLLDAAKWANKAGWAVPGKISALGTSLGGSTVLRALSRPENQFACAVTLDSLVDIPGTYQWLLANNPSMAQSLGSAFAFASDSPDTGLMQQLSPHLQTKNISKPVLLLHSSSMPGASLEASLQYATQLKTRGTPVTLATLEGKIDSWYDNKVIPPALAVSEQFFAQCLGGLAEPFGDDLANIRVKLPVGAEQIKGLSKALGPECCTQE